MRLFRCIGIFLWLNFVLDAILNMVNIAANILGAKTEDLAEGTQSFYGPFKYLISKGLSHLED